MAPLRFMGRAEVAARLGVKVDSTNGYDLPPPDAFIGKHKGWSLETIEQWIIDRPGKGNWGHTGRPRK